jgi:hypothetical protein
MLRRQWCQTRDVRMEVRNQVLMLGNAVVAEVTEKHDVHRHWLWVGRVDNRIEVHRVQQRRGIDAEDWPNPEGDPLVIERDSYNDLDSALAALTLAGVDTDTFNAIWKTSNPF